MPISLDQQGLLLPSCRILPTLSKDENVLRIQSQHRARVAHLKSVREPSIKALLDCQSDFDLLRLSALTADPAATGGDCYASYALELQRGVDEIRASFGCPFAAQRLIAPDYSQLDFGPLQNRGILDDLEHAMPFLSRTKAGMLRQNFPMQATDEQWGELDKRRQRLHVRLLSNRYFLLVRRLEIQADTEVAYRLGAPAGTLPRLQREVDELDVVTISRHAAMARQRLTDDAAAISDVAAIARPAPPAAPGAPRPRFR